jgi:PAS domain S-box-containing protein
VGAILGYAPEEILGTNASQYVHSEDLAALDFAMHTLGAKQRTASNLQARWRHRNGSYRWLERNMLALLGENGQVVGFRGSERDFTERRRQEKHISRLTRVLKIGVSPDKNVLSLVLHRLAAVAKDRPILLAGESQGAWLIADTQHQSLPRRTGVARGIDIEEIHTAARLDLRERSSHHRDTDGRGQHQFAHGGM